MEELVQHAPAGVVEQKRGTSLRELAKGVFTRFLPASVLSLFGVVVGTATIGSGQLGPLVWILARWTGFVGLGFGLGLLGLGRWLYPEAKVGGLRSVLAGFLAPLLPLAFLYVNALLGTGLSLRQWEGAAIFVLGGIAAALAMFFPWLSETPPGIPGEDGRVGDEGCVETLPGSRGASS